MANENIKDGLSQYYLTGNDKNAQLGLGVERDMMVPNYNGNFHLGMGINAPMLDVATPCTFTPGVVVVTSVPRMYMHDGRPTAMALMIKNLLETHAKSVTGVDFGYTLGTDTTAISGHDTQPFAVPTKTTRGQVNPSFTFTELSGNIIYNTFERWIWDIQHPDTNASMAQVEFPGAYTMSAYACSFMFIQFDPTMRPERILGAAHYCNVFPTETGTIGFERTIGTVKPMERTIPFTAIVQHNKQTLAVAIEIAKKLKLHVHNYDLTPPHKSEIDKSFDEGGALVGLAYEQQDKIGARTNDVPYGRVTPDKPDGIPGKYDPNSSNNEGSGSGSLANP